MKDGLELFLRSICSFGMLFILTKIMGRKELAQMSVFDYIVGISIGSIGAEMALNIEEPWYKCMLVMGVYIGLHYGLTWLSMKSVYVHKFVDGAPIIIMQKGQFIDKNLKRVRFDINTFLEECRLAGYFNIVDIEYAIVESNGRISFLGESSKNQKELVAHLIVDGRSMAKNLEAIGKDENWLREELTKRGYSEMKEIFLVTYNSKGEIRIYPKDEVVEVNHCLE